MIEKLIELKAQKKAIEKKIEAAESEIIKMLGDEIPEEGSLTKEIDGHKVRINRGITRKVDPVGARELFNLMSENIYPFIWSEEPKLDIKKFRYIQANEPGILKLLSKAITEKPRKISINIQD